MGGDVSIFVQTILENFTGLGVERHFLLAEQSPAPVVGKVIQLNIFGEKEEVKTSGISYFAIGIGVIVIFGLGMLLQYLISQKSRKVVAMESNLTVELLTPGPPEVKRE